MVQAGGVGLEFGSALGGSLVALLYQHQAVDVVRDAGEGGKNGEDNQDNDLPSASQKAASEFVIDPDEQQTDNQHDRDNPQDVESELDGPLLLSIVFGVVGHSRKCRSPTL